MDDQTERLEVERMIRSICARDVGTIEARICAYISRRDELMRKRGAVEKLEVYVKYFDGEQPLSVSQVRKAMKDDLNKTKRQVEREIAALESQTAFGAPTAKKPSSALEAAKKE